MRLFIFQPSHVWFDRLAISKQAKECRQSMEAAHEYIKDLIKMERDNGIPSNRIVVGEFFLRSIERISSFLEES